MRGSVKMGLLMAAAVAVAACPFPALAGEGDGVFTVFRGLIGSPATPDSGGASVLTVPGPVVMLGKSPEEEAKDVLDLMGKLKDSYRLGEVSLAASSAKMLTPDGEVQVPALVTDLEIRATLLAFNAKQATYGVSISEGGKVVSAPRVMITRGERGIVGSRDGGAAPYFFLTIEPLAAYQKAEINPPAVMPKLVRRVQPEYPASARAAGIDGIVVLDATIGADGAVRDLKPLRSEPMGLTEAAIKAVSQWRFEPARTAGGAAVEARYPVFVSFLLDRTAGPKPKK